MNWRLLAPMFALVAAAFVARTYYNASDTPLILDTDDAMRMVVVRDLLAGQDWFDNIQHRMNTPHGAELHWSRLADLPLAATILILRPLLGGMAENVAAYVVPLGLLFALVYLTGKATLRLVGPEGLLAAIVLPALSLTVLTEFVPGRLDHHSLQILLLMAMLWCGLESVRRARFAVGAGLAAATSMAIGVEGIPSAAAAAVAFGVIWIADPARADALRGFGVSLALTSVLHLTIALPPERWLVPACDAISPVYAAAALATGAVFVALAGLRLAGVVSRLGAGVAGGLLVAALLALAFPACLGGPYSALDPWLLANWIDKVTEAAPLLTSLLNDPAYPLAVAIPCLLALVVVVRNVLRNSGEARVEWLVYFIFLALAVAAMLIQIRASRMATSLAVPGCAALILMARHAYLERRDVARTAGLIFSWLGAAGIAIAVIVMAATNLWSLRDEGGTAALGDVADRRLCLMPEAFAALAAIPPERIMTPIDLGSHMLLYTPHHVVAAPYHRNEAGVLDAFRFFNDPIEDARTILDERGISLVVTCPALPEMAGLPDAAPDSFVKLAETGRLPDWLVDQSLPGEPLRVYAVMPKP